MKVSIIILTYNSNALILDCITSIQRMNDIANDLEIIVSDNSNLETFEELKELVLCNFGVNVKVIKTDRNGGYGYGNNFGAAYAKGEILCIMNPDVLLVKPIFNLVLNSFNNNKKLGLLGGKQLGGKNLSFFLRPEYLVPLLPSIVIKICNRFNCFFSKFFFPSGALLFFRKELFDKIKGFDENIFLYCEESDISRRILGAKFNIEFDKRIVYRHLIDGRESVDIKQLERLFMSRSYYFSKYKLNFKRHISYQIMNANAKKLIYMLTSSKDAELDMKELLSFLREQKNKL